MTKQATSNRFRVFPARPFDPTWTAERWGYPIFAQRTRPFEVADPDKADAMTTVDRVHLTGQPGYEIGHIQAVALGGLPDGLSENEPFTQADKELLARLELGEIVGAVLVPSDPRGLPEWTRLRVYLIEVCAVSETNLQYLTAREMMAIIRQHAGAETGKGNIGDRERKGRRPNRSDQAMSLARKAYVAQHEILGDSKAAWNAVADLYGWPTGDAARVAVSRWLRTQ